LRRCIYLVYRINSSEERMCTSSFSGSVSAIIHDLLKSSGGTRPEDATQDDELPETRSPRSSP
jgi:hypothetical protein